MKYQPIKYFVIKLQTNTESKPNGPTVQITQPEKKASWFTGQQIVLIAVSISKSPTKENLTHIALNAPRLEKERKQQSKECGRERRGRFRTVGIIAQATVFVLVENAINAIILYPSCPALILIGFVLLWGFKIMKMIECEKLKCTHGANTCIRRQQEIRSGKKNKNRKHWGNTGAACSKLDSCVECVVGICLYWDDVVKVDCV